MKARLRDETSRILALDVRARRIGFAVFETPAQVLEFGVTRFKSRPTALARLDRLIRRTKPDGLVLLKIPSSSTRNTRGMQTILCGIWLIARRFSVAVTTIRERQVKQHFSEQGATTKYQVSLFLVKRFPELEWKLPQPRKAWQREHPNMSMFDAAALAVTYLATLQDD
jgi:RNase H-fold protein (predicted Holliday junction resolvase)